MFQESYMICKFHIVHIFILYNKKCQILENTKKKKKSSLSQ